MYIDDMNQDIELKKHIDNLYRPLMRKIYPNKDVKITYEIARFIR